MKRLLATLGMLCVLASPVCAQTFAWPPYPIPIPPSQGGTGLSINYDSVRTADASLQHYFPCEAETTSSTHLVDTIGGNTGVTGADDWLAGMPGILNDGSKSAYLPQVADDDYLILPAALFPANNHAQTLDFWVKLTATTHTTAIGILAALDSAGVFEIGFGDGTTSWADEVGFAYNFNNAGRVGQRLPTNGILSSGPHYVAITYDGSSNLTVYFDTISVFNSTGTALNAFSGAGSLLGTGVSGATNYPLGGYVSKIAVSNTALSAATILANYKAGMGLP